VWEVGMWVCGYLMTRVERGYVLYVDIKFLELVDFRRSETAIHISRLGISLQFLSNA
jgi:hypothetical protein